MNRVRHTQFRWLVVFAAGFLVARAGAWAQDCNGNGVLDSTDISGGTSQDCNGNGTPDECDIAMGTSEDCRPDGTPDECQLGKSARALLSIHVSVREPSYPPVVGRAAVILVDETGSYAGKYAALSVCDAAWGYHDGCADGDYVYFGCAYGLTRHDPDGANGIVYINGAAPTVGTWRALAYDPTGDGGSGSFWVGNLSQSIVEVDRTGAVLTTCTNLDGWSFRGLAYDDKTGMLWGHNSTGPGNAEVWEVDPNTCRTTGVTWSSDYGWDPGNAIQGGLSMAPSGILYGILQAAPDALFSAETDGTLGGTVSPNPRDIETLIGESGVLGIAVTSGIAGGDCNTNLVPDECDVPPICVGPDCSLDCNSNLIPDECELANKDCNTNLIPDDCDIASGYCPDCNSNLVPDECELGTLHNCCDTSHGAGCSDADIEACVCSSDPFCCDAQWDDICVAKVAAIECGSCDGTDCNTNGVPDDCDIAAGTSLDANNNRIPDNCQSVVFVSADALGQNDGTSWSDAYNELQQALLDAQPGAELWVAAGTYTPDFDASSGTHDGDQLASFYLRPTIALYGGFAGWETTRAQRRPLSNLTILSGDLAGNDLSATYSAWDPTVDDNSSIIITCLVIVKK